jgi:hypothetical protein
MGVSSASQVLHRLVGLSLDHAVNAAKQHVEKNGDALPTIYIDASWHSERDMFNVGWAEGPVVGSTRVIGCLKNREFNAFFIVGPSCRHHFNHGGRETRLLTSQPMKER